MAIFAMVKDDNFVKFILITMKLQFFDENDTRIVYKKMVNRSVFFDVQ